VDLTIDDDLFTIARRFDIKPATCAMEEVNNRRIKTTIVMMVPVIISAAVSLMRCGFGL
jgi:hypothetical protein